MKEQIVIKSYSKKGDHFVLYNLTLGQQNVSDLIHNVKHLYTDYCDTNNINTADTVYCKVQSKNELHTIEAQEILSPILGSDKVTYTYQQPLLTECSIIFFAVEKNYNQEYGVEFSLASYRSEADDIELESRNNFLNIEKQLSKKNLCLLNHVIRSWIYIDDIDNNYMKFVNERGLFFNRNGMNETTRYLASTAIGMGTDSSYNGCYKSQVDLLMVSGTSGEGIERLTNYSIMPDPVDYGVHFERGLSLKMKGKKHLYISGTASIDELGNVLHLDNIEKQTVTAIKNIELLLINSHSEFADLSHLIVYLRNEKDINVVQEIVERALPADVPLLFSKGPVCRPTWLIELEGMVII